MVEKYEGLWRVSWPGLNDIEKAELLDNLISIVFACSKNTLGFSTSDGSKAYTMYFHPVNFAQKCAQTYRPDLIKTGNVKCCMFTNRKDAENFVDSVSKKLMWERLTEKNKGDSLEDSFR